MVHYNRSICICMCIYRKVTLRRNQITEDLEYRQRLYPKGNREPLKSSEQESHGQLCFSERSP